MSNFNILDFEPAIIKNFFTEEEIKEIKNTINKQIIDNISNNLYEYDGFDINSSHGSFLYGGQKTNQQFSKRIKNKIIKNAENYLGVEVEELDGFGITWQRYSRMTGFNPKLPVHVDTGEETEKPQYHQMSFSIPIDNLFIWDIDINNKIYKIENNDALLFCVTSDFHKRPLRDFSPEEKYDVIIVRFFTKEFKVDINKSKYKNIKETKRQLMKLERYINKTDNNI